MKKLFTLVIIAILFCQINGFAQNAWTTQSVSPNRLNSIYFISSEIGFTCGENGKMYKTTNAGNTWALMDDGVTLTIYDIIFTDENNGHYCGDLGTIRTTTNGGSTWTPTTTSITSTLYKFALKPNGEIFCVGNHTSAFKYTSGGWYGNFVGAGGNSVFFLDNDHGYISTYGGYVQTTNGGNNWSSLIPVPGYNYSDVAFTDVNNGYLIGTGGKIFKTTDGGTNWFQQTSGVISSSLSEIAVIDANTLVIVGTGGTILKTFDGGQNWQNISIGGTLGISSVFALSEYTIYITLSDGSIMKTSSGGDAPYINLPAAPITIPSNANNSDFDIDANTTWTASSDQSWLSIGASTGAGNSSITFSATENPDPVERTAIVTVTGSGLTNTVTIVQEANLGINDFSKSGISVYPVPAKDKLFFELPTSDAVKIKVANISGKTVCEVYPQSQKFEIDISKFAIGSYIVIFEYKDKIISKNIVIK